MTIKTTGITPNTESFERDILVAPSGFREYDCRWMFPENINLRGLNRVGQVLGTVMIEAGAGKVVVGHDYRSYSANVKQALIVGLMSAGCEVHDIGLALTPTTYFSAFHLDCPAFAMVTASHNDNGWTGIKMGMKRPLAFSSEQIVILRDRVMKGDFKAKSGGSYTYHDDVKSAYVADLVKDGPIKRKLKAVVACGNGTAGAYAPEALRQLGVEVIEMDCDLDYTFPKYNPNPEDMEMLHAIAARVKETGADVGFGFDGDGDRCGVVDNTGEEILADKVGVLLARDLSALFGGGKFIADIKSTGLFMTDPVLKANGATSEYWKTGHSNLKIRLQEQKAVAAFEKSGHYYFNAPVGRGYDDGILSAVAVCRMMDRNADKTLSDLNQSLPQIWSSPTMSPKCADEAKERVVDDVTKIFTEMMAKGQKICGQPIVDILTVAGVRVTLADGTWGLVRCSNTSPKLVIVVESPTSEVNMLGMFDVIDGILSQFPEVGAYDQKLKRAA